MTASSYTTRVSKFAATTGVPKKDLLAKIDPLVGTDPDKQEENLLALSREDLEEVLVKNGGPVPLGAFRAHVGILLTPETPAPLPKPAPKEPENEKKKLTISDHSVLILLVGLLVLGLIISAMIARPPADKNVAVGGGGTQLTGPVGTKGVVVQGPNGTYLNTSHDNETLLREAREARDFVNKITVPDSFTKKD